MSFYDDDPGCSEDPTLFEDDFNVFEEFQIARDNEGDDDYDDDDYNDDDDNLAISEAFSDTPMGIEMDDSPIEEVY